MIPLVRQIPDPTVASNLVCHRRTSGYTTLEMMRLDPMDSPASPNGWKRNGPNKSALGNSNAPPAGCPPASPANLDPTKLRPFQPEINPSRSEWSPRRLSCRSLHSHNSGAGSEEAQNAACCGIVNWRAPQSSDMLAERLGARRDRPSDRRSGHYPRLCRPRVRSNGSTCGSQLSPHPGSAPRSCSSHLNRGGLVMSRGRGPAPPTEPTRFGYGMSDIGSSRMSTWSCCPQPPEPSSLLIRKVTD